MRRAAIAAAVLAAVLGGCKDDEDEGATLAREGDAALVVVVDRTPSGVAFADEAEPNDDPGAAQSVSVPGGIKGTLDGETDLDLYRVEMEEAGQLAAVVDGLEEIDLILDVRDAKGELLVRSDRAPAEHSEGVPNYALEPGSYLVQVHEFVRGREKGSKGARTGPSPTYELTLELREPGDADEREPNGDAGGAGELAQNEDVFGYIGWHEDHDMWKVPLGGVLEGDALDLELTGVPWVKPTLELLGEDGAVVLTREGRRGKPLHVRNIVPESGHESAYVRLSSGRSNPEEPYRIGVTTRSLEPDEETEPNDREQLASPLREDTTVLQGERRGALDAGDVDFYRMEENPGPRVFHATVEPSSSVDVSVEVLVMGQTAGEAKAGAHGASESVSAIPVPAGRPLVLVVRGDASADGGDYRVRWSLQ